MTSPLFSGARWDELRALLETLAEASPEARAAELERIAARDADLAAVLRELLTGTRDAPTPPPEQVLGRLMPSAPDEVPARVGPFRLLARIGAGGMGVIYLAEREHADFVQRVALKLLDGGSTRVAQLASRERRILAALAHPNITAFVDAGVEDGRAWLAMEYVDGVSLLEYGRQHALDVRGRVRLFDQICAAVAHAHAQLVVHRDLKPANVLVNTEGTVKLLDFGIALILDPSEESEPATRVFTPEYAAPEQLRGERATTATDVYGLGLILYELIVGKRLPTLERGAREGEWTTAELARHATTRDDANPAPEQYDVKALSKLLRGDLGRIIVHALRPLPAQRYSSVTSLREDLARWLDYRPLAIGRATMAYATRRFVQRHRLGASLAAAGLIAILGLAATALWQAHAKSIEAEHARAALRQSEATRDFITSVFLSADPYQGKGTKTTAGELLAAARTRIDKELAQEPDVAAALWLQIGNVYVALGDDVPAHAILHKALEANARSAQPSPIIEGSAKARLAFFEYQDGHTEDALRGLHAAITQLRAAGVDALSELAAALRMQSSVFYDIGRGDEAVVGASESVSLLQGLGATHDVEYLGSLESLADMLTSLDRHNEALAQADLALAHPYLHTAEGAELANQLRGVRARALTGLERYAEAEPLLAQVIVTSGASFGADNAHTRYWNYRHVQVLQELGRLDEARAELNVLLTTPASNQEHPLARVAQRVTLAGIDNQRRDPASAARAQEAQDAACGEHGNPAFCAKARLLSAEVAIRERRSDAARSALDVCAKDENIGKSATLARRLVLLRAQLERDTGKLDGARALLAGVEKESGLAPGETAQLDLERGYLALAAGDKPAAIAALGRARAYQAKSLTTPTPLLKEIDTALASVQAKP